MIEPDRLPAPAFELFQRSQLSSRALPIIVRMRPRFTIVATFRQFVAGDDQGDDPAAMGDNQGSKGRESGKSRQPADMTMMDDLSNTGGKPRKGKGCKPGKGKGRQQDDPATMGDDQGSKGRKPGKPGKSGNPGDDQRSKGAKRGKGDNLNDMIIAFDDQGNKGGKNGTSGKPADPITMGGDRRRKGGKPGDQGSKGGKPDRGSKGSKDGRTTGLGGPGFGGLNSSFGFPWLTGTGTGDGKGKGIGKANPSSTVNGAGKSSVRSSGNRWDSRSPRRSRASSLFATVDSDEPDHDDLPSLSGEDVEEP